MMYEVEPYEPWSTGGGAKIAHSPRNVQATPVPDSVNLTRKPRVGTRQRDEAVAHINRLHGEGYLPEHERAARVGRALEAEHEGDLEHLLTDLPRELLVRPVPGRERRRQWRRSHLDAAALIMGAWFVVGGVLLSATPIGVISSVSHGLGHANGWLTTAVIVTMILGIASAIGGIAYTACWYDDVQREIRRERNG
jgi:uncharacterized protein DUF1707